MSDDRSVQMPGVLILYQRRDAADGFWIDMKVDGVEMAPLGPFDSKRERDLAYDDMLSMMRSTGAIDMPSRPQ